VAVETEIPGRDKSVSACLAQRLAGVFAFDSSQFLAMLFDEIGDPRQQ